MLEALFTIWHRIAGKFVAVTKPVRRTLARAYWTSLVRLRAEQAGPGLRVNGRTEIPGRSVRIGSNCHFNGMTVHGDGGVTIGDNFHSGRGCKIITVNHRWQDATALPYDSEVIRKPVKIGENVWFGDDVLVLPGAWVGEGAIIGAGSVVAGRIEPLTVAGGNPARPLKQRDREHYERLKREGSFH